MYEMIITITHVTDELLRYHPDIDLSSIISAYNFAARMHKGQKRKSGEAYIYHPLRVARSLASWGAGRDLVCAALLHDVVEDCDGVSLEDIVIGYGKNVARLVDSLTNLDNELHNMKKEHIDRLSDVKFQEKISAEAIYIKAADRLDNLHTIDCFPEHKRVKKAQHTREIIIPILKQEGAYRIINQLEDLCLRLEHPDNYEAITLASERFKKESEEMTNQVIMLLMDVFMHKEDYPIEHIRRYLENIIHVEYRPRSIISIYRQIISKFNKSQTELMNYISKDSIAFHELIVEISENNGFQASALFQQLHDYVLVPNGIKVINYGQTTYKHSEYYTLQDREKNLYRLYIKTEQQYNEYMYGHLLDENLEHRNLRFRGVDRFDPHNTYKKKIKVFTPEYDVRYIDEGATMLDFAYSIYPPYGYKFDYALVDNSKMKRKPYDRLSEGDRIDIKTKEGNIPRINHFKYVKTSVAIEALTKYIKESSKEAFEILKPLLTTEYLTEEDLQKVLDFFEIFKKKDS